MMKIQVVAEREQKIQTEVKEIRKVFFCELCNKQYKLAMEFEVHLSSYDHNHRKVCYVGSKFFIRLDVGPFSTGYRLAFLFANLNSFYLHIHVASMILYRGFP